MICFFYIESIKLSARSGSTSAKDIAVEVKLLEPDEDISAPGLPAIYNPGKRNFINTAVTSVVYHNKNPSFYQEFKIKLPPQYYIQDIS